MTEAFYSPSDDSYSSGAVSDALFRLGFHCSNEPIYGIDYEKMYDEMFQWGDFKPTEGEKISELRELELINSYLECNPGEHAKWCIEKIMYGISKVAGFDFSEYIVPKESGLGDSNGIMRSSSTKWTTICLCPLPVNPEIPNYASEEEVRFLSSVYDAQYNRLMPPLSYADDALKTVLDIICAKKIRDDRKDKESTGVIVWRGEYRGVVVYVQITYNASYGSVKGLMKAVIFDESNGKTAAEYLNELDFETLESMGFSKDEIRNGVEIGLFTHTMVESIRDSNVEL